MSLSSAISLASLKSTSISAVVIKLLTIVLALGIDEHLLQIRGKSVNRSQNFSTL